MQQQQQQQPLQQQHESTKVLFLWTHQPENEDVIINPDYFPNIKVGHLLQICPTSLNPDRVLITQVTSIGKFPLQISISQTISNAFNLKNRTDVAVRKISPTTVKVDHIELTIHDQYIGRPEMWRLKHSLNGHCVYVGQQISYAGVVRAQVQRIYIRGQLADCGYIVADTKAIFRSESAKYFIFIQMCKEMWDFDEDGELFFEKCVYGFLPDLFYQWKQRTNHVLSIVLFSRVFYEEEFSSEANIEPDLLAEQSRIGEVPSHEERMAALKNELLLEGVIDQLEDGRWYKDFYKVIIDWETRTDWTSVITDLAAEYRKFQQGILLRPDPISRQQRPDAKVLCGRNSMAFEGNILEAVNLALNPFDKHYVDRDLMRTGLSIVVISPGAGKFKVDKKLLRLTTERMTDNGIAMDLVCLSKLPLHVVPLFQFNSTPKRPTAPIPETTSGASNTTITALGLSKTPQTTGIGKDSSKSGIIASTGPSKDKEMIDNSWDPLYFDDSQSKETETYFAMPHWIDCSFYSPENQRFRFVKEGKFETRCKMYELQMMGMTENEISSISIPYLGEEDIDIFGSTATGSSGNRSKSLRIIDEHGTLKNSRDTPLIDVDKYDERIFANARRAQKYKLQPQSLSIPSSRASNRGSTIMNGRHGSIDGTLDVLRNANAGTDSSSFSHRSDDMIHTPVSRGIIAGNSEISRSLPKSLMVTFNRPILSAEFPEEGTPTAGTWHVKPGRTTMHIQDVWDKSPSWTGGLDSPMADGSPVLARRANRAASLGQEVLLGPSEHSLQPSYVSLRRAYQDNDDFRIENSSTVEAIAINGNRTGIENHAIASSNGSSRDSSVKSDDGTNRKNGAISTPSRGFNNRRVFKQTVINPSNPSKSVFKAKNSGRRWQHIFPKPADAHTGSTQWISLCTPACLPLTTDYMPNLEEYKNYIYTVEPGEDPLLYKTNGLSEQDKAENLLIEMISQRLAQGFQLIYSGPEQQVAPKSSVVKGFTIGENRHALEKVNSANASAEYDPTSDISKLILPDIPYKLSMGHHVHSLTLDLAARQVEMRRYVKPITYQNKDILYRCVVWPKLFNSYSQRDVQFSYPNLEGYNWNYSDFLIAGYQYEYIESLRYWRTRFLLIPAERLPEKEPTSIPTSLNDEEHFQTFLNMFTKARLAEQDEAEGKKPETNILSDINNTTMDPAAYWSDEARKAIRSQTDRGSLTKDTPLKTIAEIMQNTEKGIKMQDRRWHAVKYEFVFVGSEFVDWLIYNFKDINARDDAVEYGNSFMNVGIIRSSTKRQEFYDGHFFYNLSPEYVNVEGPPRINNWFSKPGTRQKKPKNKGKEKEKEKEMEKEKDKADEQFQANGSSTNNRSIIELYMSKKLVIDVDLNNKSRRREMAILHYDTVHNVRNCYHFQLNWVGCTARLIEDLLHTWARQAERCGLKLVEAPVEQAFAMENNNPFQSPVPIKLASMPPEIPTKAKNKYKIDKLFFERELVKSLGYILDIEADDRFPQESEGIKCVYTYLKTQVKYTQYVHSSGVAFVQVAEPGEGFYWINNRLFFSHTPAVGIAVRTPAPPIHPEDLRLRFVKFCSDSNRLKSFWDHTLEKLMGDKEEFRELLDNQPEEPEGYMSESSEADSVNALNEKI